jgi:hypothetical protein
MYSVAIYAKEKMTGDLFFFPRDVTAFSQNKNSFHLFLEKS